jgi:uncharacterized iron-regulated membrane protein
MNWATLHRWLAIVLVVLLVVWSVTGLLFHLKPGWDRAYDMLSVDRRKTETLETVLGPLTRTQGTLAAPLSVADAETLARDALERSAQRAAYGAITRVSHDEQSVSLHCENATVLIDRTSARISQKGADTERIDWLYRVHYLQWTGNPSIDKFLAIAGLALIWAVMIPGIVLFVRRLRQ